jgi:colanic acid/amylovoran biosynthesis protein
LSGVTVRIGLIQLGSVRGGVQRYGRVLASHLEAHTGTTTEQVHADFDRRSAGAALAACFRAAWRVRRADAVVVPYSSYLWGPRRVRFVQAAILHLVLRRRTVLVLHDVYQTGRARRRALRPDAERVALAVHLRLAGGVVVHAEHERWRLAGLRGSERVHVIPHFIEQREQVDRSAARRKFGVPAGDFVVSVLGYIHPRKGHRLLVEAIPSLDADVKLWFIGGAAPGAEQLVSDLQALAERRGVGARLTVTGYVDEEELQSRLAATDLAACPFEDVSASGSLATWLSACRPALVTDLPPLRELSRQVPSAIRLLTRRSPEAVRAGVREARGATPPDRAAFESLLRDRSPQRTAERFGAICAGLARRRRRPDRVTIAVRAGALAGRIRRRLRRGAARIALVPSAAPGSSGDEALVRSSLAGLRSRRPQALLVAEYPGERSWSEVLAVDGGVDLTAWWRQSGLRGLVPAGIRLGWRIGSIDELYLVGADVLDGAYSEAGSIKRMAVLDLAARTGARAVVLGASWNASPAPAVVEWARRMHPAVRWCARDPESHERMHRDLRRDVELTADTAFLLSPSSSHEGQQALEFVSSRRAEGRVVIGVNLNPLATRDGQAPALVAACTKAVAAAVRDGGAVVFLPHDGRGDPSDLSLVRDVHAALPTQARERAHLPGGVLAAQEMKAVLGELDGVVAGRMHVGIGALSQAVPTRLADIQGKVTGLYRHLGLEGGAYRVDDVLATGSFGDVFEDLLVRRLEERALLELRLPEIRRLARENFRPAAGAFS